MASEAGGEQVILEELQDKSGDSVNSSLSSPDCRKEFMNLKETEDSAKINSDETISVPLLDLNRIEAEQCCVSSTTMYHSIQNDEVKAEISKPVTLGPCACSEGEVLVETPSRVQDPLPDVNNGSYSIGENLKAHVTNRNNEGNVDEGNDNQVETYEEMIAMTSNEAARDHAATVLSIDEHHTGETGEVITNLSEVGNDTLKYEGKVTRNYDGPTCLQLKDENGIEERKIEDVENTSAILVHDRDNYHEEIIDLKPHMVVANVAEIPSVQHKYAENEHEVFSRKDNEMLAKSCEYQDNQETIEVRPSSDEEHNNEENELLMTETSQKEGEKEDSLLNAESYIEPKEDDPNDLITNNPIEKEVTNIEIIGDTIKLQEESTLKDKLLANAEEITKDDTNYTKVEETAELMPEYKSTVSRNMIEQMKVAVPSSEKEKDVCIGDLTVLEKMGSEDSLLTLGNNGDLVPQSINHIKRESGSDNDEKPSKVSTEDYTHNNIGDTATNDDLGDTFNENELDCKESKRHTSLEPNTKPTYEEEDDAKLTGTDMKNSQDMEDSPEEVDKTDSLDEAEGNIDDNTTVIGDHDTSKQKLEINDVQENVIVAEECIAKEDDAIEETHHEGEIKAESSAEVAARMRNEESNSESEMSRSVIDGETFKLMAKDDLERNEKDALVLPIVHDTVGKESANDTTEEKLAVYEENGKLDNQMLDISYGDDKPQVGPTDNETDINTFAVMVDDKYIKENIDDSVDVVGKKHDTPNINEEELVDENSNQNTEFNVHKDKNNKVAVEVQPTNAGYHINEDEEISKSGKEEEVSKLLADKDELILSKAHEIINQEYADDPVLVEEKHLILEEKNEELRNTIVDSSDNRDKSQIGQTDTKVADDKNIKENLDDSTDVVGENNDALNINEELMDQNSKDNTESDVHKNEDHKNEVEIATIGGGDKENLDDSTDTVGENNDAPSIIEELMSQNTEDNTKSDVHKNEDHKVEVEITPSGDGDHSSADEEISRSDIDEEKASKLMVEDEMKKNENESLVSAKAQEENIAVESAADSALVEKEKEPVYEEKNEDLGNNTVDMSYGDNNNQGGPTDIEISDTTPANTMDDKCTEKSYDDSIDAVGETHETPNINEEERMSQDIQDSIESDVHKDEDHNVEVVIAPTTDGDHINDDEDVSEEKNDGLGNDKVDFSYGDGKTQGPIKDEIITNESTDDSVLVEDEEQPEYEEKNGADNDLVCFSYGGDGKTQVGPTNAEICDTTSLKMDDKSIKESFDDSLDDGEKHEAHNVIEKEQMDQNSKMESDVHKDEVHNVAIEVVETNHGYLINEDEKISRSDIDEEKTSKLIVDDDLEKNENDSLILMKIHEAIAKESEDDSVLANEEEIPTYEEKNEKLGNDVYFSYGDDKPQVGSTEAEICDTTYLKMADDKTIRDNFDDSTDVVGEKHDADNISEEEQMNENRKPNTEFDVHKDEDHYVAVNENDEISRSNNDEENTSKLITEDDLEKNERDSLSYSDDKLQVGQSNTETHDNISAKKVDDRNIENFNDSIDAVTEINVASNINEEERMNQNAKENTESEEQKYEDHKVETEVAPTGIGYHNNEDEEISTIDEEGTSKLMTEDDPDKKEKDAFIPEVSEIITKEPELVHAEEEKQSACEEKKEEFDFSYSDKFQVGQSDIKTHNKISTKTVDDNNIEENFNDSIDADDEKNDAPNINEEEMKCQNFKFNIESDLHKDENHEIEAKVALAGSGDYINENEEISAPDIDEEDTSKLMTQDDLEKNQNDAFIVPEVSETITKQSADDLVRTEEAKQSVYQEKNKEFDFSYRDDKLQVEQTVTEMHDTISAKTVDANDSLEAYINEEERMSQNSKDIIESDSYKNEDPKVEADLAPTNIADHISAAEEISVTAVHEEDMSMLTTQDDLEKNENDAYVISEVHETSTKESADDSVYFEEKESVYEEKIEEFDSSHCDDKLQVGQTDSETHDTIAENTVNDSNIEENLNDPIDAVSEKSDAPNINEEETIGQHFKESIESDVHEDVDHKVEVDVAPLRIREQIIADEKISMTGIDEEDVSTLMSQDDPEKNENDAFVIPEVHETSTRESADDPVHFEEEKESVYQEKIEEFDSSYCDDKLQVEQENAGTHDTISAKTLDDNNIQENLNDSIDEVSEKSDAPNINQEEMIGQFSKDIIELGVHKDEDHKDEPDVAPASIGDHISATNEEISVTGMVEEDMPTLTTQDDLEKNEDDAFVIPEVHETSTIESADDSVHFEEEKESVYQEKIEEFDSSYCDDKLQVGQTDVETHDTTSAKTVDDNNVEENFDDSIDGVSKKSDAPDVNEEGMIGQISKDIIELDVHKDEDHKIEADVAPASIGHPISVTDKEISMTAMDEEHVPTLTTQEDLEKNVNDAFVIPEVHETITKEFADETLHFEEENESVYEEKIEEFDSSYCDDKLQVGQTGVETHDTTSAKTVDDNNIEENFDDSIDGVSKKSDAPDVNEEGMIGQISKDIIELDVHKDEDHKIEADVAPASIGHPISVTDKEISMTAMDEEHVPTLTTQEDLEKNVNDAFVIPEVHETITKEFADETLHFQEENESVYEEKIEEFDSSYCDDKLQVGQTGVETHDTTSAKTVDDNNVEENFDDSIDGVSKKSDAPDVNEEGMIGQISKDIIELDVHKDEDHKVEADVAPASIGHPISVTDEEISMTAMDEEDVPTLTTQEDLEKNVNDAFVIPEVHETITKEFADETLHFQEEKESVYEEKIEEFDSSYCDDKLQVGQTGVEIHETVSAKTVDNNNIKENLNDSIDAVSEKSDAPNINEEEIVDQKSKDITGLGDHKDEEDKVEAEVAPARSEVHINADEEISGFDIDEEASKLILEDGLEKNDKDALLLPKGQDMIANEFVDDSSLVKQEKELVDEEKIAESDYKMVDMSYGDDKHQLSKSGVDEAEASKSETKEDVQKNEEEASVLPKVQYIIDKQSADDSVLIEGKEQLVHEKKNQELGNNAADFSHHDDKLQAGSTHTATSDPIDSKALDDESVKGNLEDSVDTVAEKHNANEEHNHILEIKESDDSHNYSKDTEELVQNTNETHEFERTDCQNMDMLREGSQPQNIGEMSIIEDYDAQINYNHSGDSEIIKKAAGLEESNEEEVRKQIIVSNDIILDAELPLEVMVQENHHETTEDSKFIEECSLGDEQENEEQKGSDQPTKENDLKHVNETFKEAEDNQISQKDAAEQIPDNIAENDNTDKNSDSFSNEVPERIIVAQTCNSAEEHNEDNQEKQEISFQENLAEICLPYQDTLAGTETENAYDTPHTEHQVKETNFSSYRSSEIAESEPREETLPYQETSTSKEDALSTNVDSPENDMKEDVIAVSLEDHIQEAIVNVQHMETNVSDNKSQEDKESGDILVIKEIKHQQEEGITDVISHVKLSKDFFTKEDNKGSGDDEGHSDSSSQNEKSQSVYTSKPSYIDDEGHEQDIERVLKTNTGEEQEENNRANLEMKVERRNTENSTEEELLEGQKPKNPIELVCDKQEQGEGTEIIHATIENSLQTNRNEVLNALNDLDPVKCNNEHTQGSNVLENIFKEEKTLQTEDSNEGNEETQEEKNDDLLVNGKPVEKNIELSNRYIGNLESEKLQKTTNFSECNIWPQEDASGTVASDAIKIKQSAEVSHKPKNIEQEINVEPKETNTMMHETPNDKIGEHGSTSLGENFLITRPIEAIGITSVLEEDQKKNLDDSSTGMKSDVQVKNNEISEFTFGECTQEDIEPNTENLETNAIGMMPEDAKSVDNTKETENLPEEAMRSQFAVDNPIMTEGNLSYLASDELNIDGQIKVPAEYQNMNSSEETSKEEKYFSTDNTVNEAISASVQEEEKKKDNSEEASPEALNLESAETENNQQPNLDDLPVSRFLMEKILRDEDAKVENSHTMECEERVQEDDIGEQHDDNSIIKQDRKINTFSDEEVTKDTGISGDKGNNIVQKSRVLVHGESVEKKTENAMTQDGQTPENNTHDWSPESEGRGGSEIKPFCLQSEMQATSNDHMELASGEQSEEPSKTIDKTFKELDHVQDEKIPDVFLEGMTGSNIQDEIESLDMESNVLPIVNESERDVLLKESTRSFEEDETIEKAPNTVLGEQKAFSDLHGEAKLSDHGGISSDFLSTKSGVFHGEPEILGGTPEIKFTSEIASETAEKEMVDEEETSGIQRQSENSNINEASKVSDLYEVHHFGASEQHTHEHIQVDEMILQGTTVNMHEKGTSEKEANNKEGIVESQTQYGNRDINQELKAPDEIQQFDVTEEYIKDFIQVEEEGETRFDIYKKGIEDEKEAQQEEAKTDDEKDNKEEDEHEQEHEESIDQPVIMVDARDTDLKSSQKKSHNILSGMGSKVKHSLAKVKKAITGKSSHAKTVSPRQEKPTVNTA